MNARKFGVVLTLRRKKPGAWPALAAPVRVIETQARIRAQSLLCDGSKFLDESTQPPTLTLDQALTVLRWARDPLVANFLPE